MRPQFDHDEEFLIAYYRQYRRSTGVSAIGYDLAFLIPGGGLFGFGLMRDDLTWAAIGFGIIAFRLIQGMISSARYNRTLATIVEKYESALRTKLADDNKRLSSND